MGRKVFVTFVKPNHKLGGNKYVQGRIRGIANVICERCITNGGYGIALKEDGSMSFPVKCTAWRYRKFAKVVEACYPGLCVFDCNKWM